MGHGNNLASIAIISPTYLITLHNESIPVAALLMASEASG
jgi:hypothetical protein